MSAATPPLLAAYIDASVLLRVVLGQAGRLPEWKRIGRGVASGLVEVECLRTIDRLRVMGVLSDQQTAARREATFAVLDALEMVDLTPNVLHRAAQPQPTPLGTLDAIHLATAMLWRETRNAALTIATHDRTLALAARANGFPVIGV